MVEYSEAPAVDHKLEEEAVAKVLEGFLASLTDRDRDFFQSHMMTRPARRLTADKFKMTEDQVRYLEKKLKEKAVDYLKKTGYLDSAGADLQKAAAAAMVIWLTLFPNSFAAVEHPLEQPSAPPSPGRSL